MAKKDRFSKPIQFTKEEKGSIILLVIIVIVALLLSQGNNGTIPRKTAFDAPTLPTFNLDLDDLPDFPNLKNPKNKLSYCETLACLNHLKDGIENRGCYILFHCSPFKEKHLQCIFDLACRGIKCDINKEVNNGRGNVDFKISMGQDQTLIEFKMASNPHLRRNLKHQIDIYAKANNDPEKFIVIVYKTLQQEKKVNSIIQELNLKSHNNIILINARQDDKPSASVAC